MKAWKPLALATVVFALSLGIAALTRHRLIEPADLTAYCDGGADSALCVLRAWTIQAFVHQRIGWFALVFAIIATVTASRGLALVALVSASVGVMLYTAELCAPALLLAMLVFVPAGQAAPQASVSKSAQYPKA